MSEFTDYLQEVFEPFGPIAARRMFGGYGIYHDGIMFALVADDMLYMKADDANAHYFEEKGLSQFEYPKANKMVKLSYYQAPEEIMEDPVEAAIWARRSFEVALRAKRKKK